MKLEIDYALQVIRQSRHLKKGDSHVMYSHGREPV